MSEVSVRIRVGHIAVAALLAGCHHGNDSTPGRVVSPSGRYTAVTSVNRSKADMAKYLHVGFETRDAAGKLLHRERTGASDRMRWEFEWDANDRLWMHSSDIGTYSWERGADGAWIEVTPRSSDRMAPPRLKRHHDRLGLPR